jgi:hypothetical protein
VRTAATPILDYLAELVDDPVRLQEHMRDREKAIAGAQLDEHQRSVLLSDDLVLVHQAIELELGRDRPQPEPRPTVMVGRPTPDEPEPEGPKPNDRRDAHYQPA